MWWLKLEETVAMALIAVLDTQEDAGKPMHKAGTWTRNMICYYFQ